MLITKLSNKVIRWGKTFAKTFTNKGVTKNITPKRVNSTCDLTLNTLKHDTVQITSKTTQLADKGTVLPIGLTKKKPNIIDAYDLDSRYQYFKGREFFDTDDMKFVEGFNPKLLKKQSIPANENVIFISNFEDIPGTIAATTDLSKCIATDGLYQCAALSVVDRSLNKQTLVHVFPKFSVESNEALIRKILSGSKPENLEISIIHGCRYYTKDTVAFLADKTKKLVPQAKIDFCNLPAIIPLKKQSTEGLVRFFEGDSAIWLKDGKLFCCNNDEIPNKIVNPREFLTYFS